MSITFKKTKNSEIFMAFYGHIGFAAVLVNPGSRKMNLGLVPDVSEVKLDLETCNRADFETFIEGINDPSGIASMYKGLVKLVTTEKLNKVIKHEE